MGPEDHVTNFFFFFSSLSREGTKQGLELSF